MDLVSYNSGSNVVRNFKSASRLSNCELTCLITPWIVLQSVQLLLLTKIIKLLLLLLIFNLRISSFLWGGGRGKWGQFSWVCRIIFQGSAHARFNLRVFPYISFHGLVLKKHFPCYFLCKTYFAPAPSK